MERWEQWALDGWEQWVAQFDDIRNWLRLDISTEYVIFTHALDHTIGLLARLDGRNYGLAELLSWNPKNTTEIIVPNAETYTLFSSN